MTDAPTPDYGTATDPAAPAPAPDAPTTSDAPSSTDLKAQLDEMQRKFEQLATRVSSGQLTATPQDDALTEKVAELRKSFADWPQQGSDSPQPWDLRAHGLPQPGVTRDYLAAGQPDELSPVVLAHNKPQLQAGMAGEQVAELGTLLGGLGYPNSISEGRNHVYAFDDSVAGAVAMFKRDYGVSEDPSQYPPNTGQHEYMVGPWVWAAILRATARQVGAGV